MNPLCDEPQDRYRRIFVTPLVGARCGQVAEWFKAAVLKTAVGESSPWVRIPPCPPITNFCELPKLPRASGRLRYTGLFADLRSQKFARNRRRPALGLWRTTANHAAPCPSARVTNFRLGVWPRASLIAQQSTDRRRFIKVVLNQELSSLGNLVVSAFRPKAFAPDLPRAN